MPVTFVIRYAHPSGRLQAQRKLRCATATKSNQKMPQPYGEA